MTIRLLAACLSLLLLAGCAEPACTRTPTPAEAEASFSVSPAAEDVQAALERGGWNVTPRPSAPHLSAHRSVNGTELTLNVTLLPEAPATTILRLNAPAHRANDSAGAQAVLAPAMDALLRAVAEPLGTPKVVQYRAGTSACENE